MSLAAEGGYTNIFIFPPFSLLYLLQCVDVIMLALLSELMCVFCSSYLKQIKEELIPGVANWQLGLEVTMF